MRMSECTARYQQILDHLVEQISSGIYSPGTQLPTEVELSRTFQVHRHTVRVALRELKNDGLVYSIRGKGNFVSSDKIIYRLSNKVRFSQNMLEANLTPGSRLLSSNLVPADEKLAARLAMATGDQVLVLEILRFVNLVPFCLATSYLPAARFSGLIDHIHGSFSLYSLLLKHYQVEPVRHESLFEVSLPNVRESELLQISSRNPFLLVRSLSCDQNRQPVEYVVTRIRGDLGCLSVNFIEHSQTKDLRDAEGSHK